VIATVHPAQPGRGKPVAQLDNVHSVLRLNYKTLRGLTPLASASVAKPTLSETTVNPTCRRPAEHVKVQGMKINVWRAVTEIGFIIFLFYSNLLMGEFTRSGMERGRGLAWAIEDIFTEVNFAIAVIAALIGYLVFEFLRKRL
jgi:hypothetical protein